MATLGLVSLRGLYVEAFAWTFLGASGMTAADVGKAVTLDTTAANTVKLAGDGNAILGKLSAVEVRTQDGVITCTVETKGGHQFLLNPNATASSPDELPAVGEFIEGGTATDTTKGWVQKLQSGTSKWQVVEVTGTTSVVAISV